MTKHVSKEESSGNFDEDYSQEFDSYSQSMMSKGATAQKKKDAKEAKEPSMSDYSDSYYSISVSQSLKRWWFWYWFCYIIFIGLDGDIWE